MFRTHTCGELRISNVNAETTLAWLGANNKKIWRHHFVDLRDRYGITQLLFGEELNQQAG
jgi:aspartyl-tRNA synthetase